MDACTLEAARLTAFAVTQLGSLEDQICTQFVRNLLPRVWVSVYRGACMEGEGGGVQCVCMFTRASIHEHLYRHQNPSHDSSAYLKATPTSHEIQRPLARPMYLCSSCQRMPENNTLNPRA